MTIDGVVLGTHTYVIAELSANHAGSLDTALQTIKAIKEAGANAVKLQTYTPETMTLKSDKPDFRIQNGSLWDGRTLYELYQEAAMPWSWQITLAAYAKEIGLTLFSSPFDASAVDFLETLHLPAYKIASFEIGDLELIAYVARKRKPMLLSTGIATREEILRALEVCALEGNQEVALLHCTSSYPTPIEDAKLSMIRTLAEDFGVLTGFSDHTSGIEVAPLAVAAGARIIEKHVKLDHTIKSPDAAFSITVAELKTMIESIRKTDAILGEPSFELTSEKVKARHFARSLYVVKPLAKGEMITALHLKALRPGFGAPPYRLKEILGKKSVQSFDVGDAFIMPKEDDATH